MKVGIFVGGLRLRLLIGATYYGGPNCRLISCAVNFAKLVVTMTLGHFFFWSEPGPNS